MFFIPTRDGNIAVFEKTRVNEGRMTPLINPQELAITSMKKVVVGCYQRANELGIAIPGPD